MSRQFVFYAPNVHTGGGFVLLRALLDAWPQSMPLTVFLDARARATLQAPMGAKTCWVRPTVAARLTAEFALRRAADVHCTVLCFHDLPPLLSSLAKVMVFQQNKNLFWHKSLPAFGFRTRVRLTFERAISRMFRHHVTQYIVQTPSMQRALLQWYGEGLKCGSPDVRLLPFVDNLRGGPRISSTKMEWDFIYVADGEAHKNHLMLLAAWHLLARDGLHPSLALTLTQRDTLLKQAVEAQAGQAGLRIKDLGQLPHARVLSLYSTVGALIFPSVSESFGLPLFEASRIGLPILAPELDYVRDVCTPAQTFDPASPVSIARAVKRFLQQPEPALKLLTPQEFWQELLWPPPGGPDEATDGAGPDGH